MGYEPSIWKLGPPNLRAPNALQSLSRMIYVEDSQLLRLMVQKSGEPVDMVAYPMIYRALAPSQVVVLDFWTINGTTWLIVWFGTRLGQIDLHQLAIHILFGPWSSGNAMLCEKSKGGISPYPYISWTSLCRYLCQEIIGRDFNTLQLQHKAWPHHFQLIEELSRTPLTFNERIIGEDKFNTI